ncbi:hypothetical protein GCM10023148_00990 [Actinokineospora soli]
MRSNGNAATPCIASPSANTSGTRPSSTSSNARPNPAASPARRPIPPSIDTPSTRNALNTIVEHSGETWPANHQHPAPQPSTLNPQPEPTLRPIDLAREHGLSAQAIRNYEDAGVLPPTPRTETGYRRYTPLHAQALRAFLALRTAHGHPQATEIMRAINTNNPDAAYRLIDATHLALHTERTTHAEVANALTTLSTTPLPAPTPLTIGELSHRIGVHPATLRTWESAGLLHPTRDKAGHRLYTPTTIRDAEITRQLRRGGHPLPHIATFLTTLHEAGTPTALRPFLDAWQTRLTTRSRALLTAAAELHAYLSLRPDATTVSSE